jgi:hypothetical protein
VWRHRTASKPISAQAIKVTLAKNNEKSKIIVTSSKCYCHPPRQLARPRLSSAKCIGTTG